jgi:glycosyltransferase involved in cell wall biosynthesis
VKTPRLRHVLYLADALDATHAGTEDQLLELARRLPPGWVPHVWVLQDAAPAVDAQWGRPVHRLHLPPLHHPAFLPRLWAAARALRRTRIDLVHAVHADTSLVAPVLGAWAGVPVITSRRDLGYWQTPAHLALLRRLDRLAGAVAVNAQAIARRVVALEQVPPGRVCVIPNGHPPERFEAPPDPTLRARLGLPADARLVGLLANLRPLKRPGDLLEALARLGPDLASVHALWIGAGPGWEALEQRARVLGLAGRVHRTVATDGVAPLLGHLDVGVLCSESEGLSNAIIEYMGCGLPVVATDVGGNPELVQHGLTGLLYPPGDVDALARHLRALLSDGGLRARLGAAGRERARTSYGVGRMVRETVTCYERVLADARPATCSAPAERALRWEILRDPEKLEALAPDWRVLLGPERFFVGPDWILAWLRARGARPCVAVARDADGTLVGLLPLAWEGRRTLVSCARGLGSDHVDVVAAPGRADEVARGALACLQAEPWTRLRLFHVAEDGALRRVLRARGVSTYGERFACLSPYVRPEGTWETWLATRRGQASGRAVRRALRRALEREGAVLRWVRAGPELEAARSTLFDLHARRFAARGARTSFRGSQVAALHAALHDRLAPRGEVVVGLLEQAGRAVGAIYALRHRDRLLYFQTGFDPAAAHLSPGRVLLAGLLRDRVFGDGLTELDLLDGDEAYKLQWATGTRRLYDLEVVRPTVFGRLGLAWRGLLRLGADAVRIWRARGREAPARETPRPRSPEVAARSASPRAAGQGARSTRSRVPARTSRTASIVRPASTPPTW